MGDILLVHISQRLGHFEEGAPRLSLAHPGFLLGVQVIVVAPPSCVLQQQVNILGTGEMIFKFDYVLVPEFAKDSDLILGVRGSF